MGGGTAVPNLMADSETLDLWSAKTRITVTPNAIESPDGATTMDRLVADLSVPEVDYKMGNGVIGVTAGVHTFSVYFKEGEFPGAILYDASNTKGAFFDINAGTAGSTFVGAPTAKGVEAVPGYADIFRCWIRYTSGTACNPLIYLAQAGEDAGFASDGTDGLYAWGAMLNEGFLAPYQAGV